MPKAKKASDIGPTGSADNILVLEAMPDIAARIGKLNPVLHEGSTPLPFTMLDCHDGSISKTDQVLIEAGQCVILYRNGGILTQPAARKGNFVADMSDGPVKHALQNTSPLRSLLVIGEGRLSHARLALIDDQGKTHARADLSLLQPTGQGQTLVLAVLQRLRGYDKARKALAAHLSGEARQDRGPAKLSRLLFPQHEPYDPKPETAISADASAYDVANDIIRAHLAVARQNEAGIIADHDSEFLHDYRIALRKIRSVISLFRGSYDPQVVTDLKRRFSDLMNPTGRLRDLDVYLLERDAYYQLLPEVLHDGLTLMFDIFDRERRQEHRRKIRLLKSAEYHEKMAALAALFPPDKGPAPGTKARHRAQSYARSLIWHRYRKICKIARQIDDATPDEKVHELRINCKKLRYLIEFFAPLFPRARLKTLLTPLKELQENLGLFNDASVQQTALQDFLAQHPIKAQRNERAMATSIGALIAILHQRQMQERARVVASFAHFDSPAIRREFASLFHGKGA